MNKFIIVAIIFLCLSKILYAQDPTIFPSPGSITWCPGEINYYEVRTTGAQQTGCTYTWAITNGAITGGQGTFKVSVIWNDSPSTGTLKVTLTNCTEATNTSVSETYAIRSLAGRVPANAIALQQLPYCSALPVLLII